MDKIFYYPTFFMLFLQILINGVILLIGIVELLRPSSRSKYQGEERMSVLNQFGFGAFSFVIGIALMKLLLDGTVSSPFLFAASIATGFLDWPVNYFYRKRVAPADDRQTDNVELQDGGANIFVDKVDSLGHKQKQPESAADDRG